MPNHVDDLKARARILHREAARLEPGALARLAVVPELRELSPEERGSSARRRQCLNVVARELGFRDFAHARAVLTATGEVEDFGTLLYPGRCSAHWNIWSASYEEAATIRREHGGYLLAYRHQFLVVDRHFIETLGLDPDAEQWQRMGRDWVRPADPEARSELYGALLSASREQDAA